MRVIKHGDRKYYRETEHTCVTCGCKFTFKLSDICVQFDIIDEEFASCNYVLCPECKTAYILNQEEENTGDDPVVPDPEPTGGD